MVQNARETITAVNEQATVPWEQTPAPAIVPAGGLRLVWEPEGSLQM